MPPRKRWSDTEEAREALAALRSAMVGWKEAGFDVGELEGYMDRPDMTREGVEKRVQAMLGMITARMRSTATKSFPPACPRCSAQLTSKDKMCPSCGGPVLRDGGIVPYVNCPECKSRARPEDNRCPVCGHRFRAWSLFS